MITYYVFKKLTVGDDKQANQVAVSVLYSDFIGLFFFFLCMSWFGELLCQY